MIEQTYDPDRLASLADFHAKYSIDQTVPAAPTAPPAPDLLSTFAPLIAVPSSYAGHGGWVLATIWPGWQIHTQACAAMPAPNPAKYARLFAAAPALFAACVTLLNADACEDEEEQELLLAEGIEAARAAVYSLLDR